MPTEKLITARDALARATAVRDLEQEHARHWVPCHIPFLNRMIGIQSRAGNFRYHFSKGEMIDVVMVSRAKGHPYVEGDVKRELTKALEAQGFTVMGTDGGLMISWKYPPKEREEE